MLNNQQDYEIKKLAKTLASDIRQDLISALRQKNGVSLHDCLSNFFKDVKYITRNIDLKKIEGVIK